MDELEDRSISWSEHEDYPWLLILQPFWKLESQIGPSRNQKTPLWADFKRLFAGIDFKHGVINQTITAMNTLNAYRKYNERLVLRLAITFATMGATMLLLLWSL